MILYQLYAFILPAFSPKERKVATPLLLMVPVLFVSGVVFCYFVVLPGAINFLLDFNSDQFSTEVRARDYYSFTTLTMLAMGLGFQVPIAILAAVKLGVTTPKKLRKNRRYAYPGDRGAGGLPADDRSGHAASGDDPPDPPVRGQHPALRRADQA